MSSQYSEIQDKEAMGVMMGADEMGLKAVGALMVLLFPLVLLIFIFLSLTF